MHVSDNQFEGSVCLAQATLVLFSMLYAPQIAPVLSFLSLLGLSIYYLAVKKNFDYDKDSN
ncbi:MAG: hypothetical protein A2908_02540 [Candidatus Staskawiczbacteria bacterium RIFCSPLOWO2_01_FULL_38_12b]|uniref:Uncharacterized protein n=1 Tax=Candidatus Staskawiczbacteria bacterium RIFCSPLOWO2_01_FULL_38_12b TaxID=1802214 RepID=A0A1G2IAX2_9BACT|nr:MAG: hypothetical protein A2908_02540 [Candidatus Staskawiczbacteria bacterium RIFCSPLOWO2_01_FULL_38_12b]